MEADTSIRRKTGHFYFALTRTCHHGLATREIPQRDQRLDVARYTFPA